MPAPHVTLASHFVKRPPEVRALYDRLLGVVRKWGIVLESPNTGSIHLVRETVFAGVRTRPDGLLLSFKSTTDLDSPRIVKRERPSANRWYLYVKVATAKDFDRELLGWLETSWEMSG